MNRDPQTQPNRAKLLKLTGRCLAVAALAACQSPGGKTEANPSLAPTTAPSASAAAAVGKVCTGLFTQKLANGDVWVVGRPVIGDDGQPQEVLTNEAGISVEPTTAQEGTVAWYSLGGQPLGNDGVDCKQSQLYARQLTHPNESQVWVATTNQAAAIPKYWDARALDPAGFGGVDLDYGIMPAAHFAEMLDAATKK
jgi:hypothetical protein